MPVEQDLRAQSVAQPYGANFGRTRKIVGYNPNHEGEDFKLDFEWDSKSHVCSGVEQPIN